MDNVPRKINRVIFSPRKIIAVKDANRGEMPINEPVKAAPILLMLSNEKSLPRNGAIAPARANNMMALESKFRDGRKMNVNDHSVIVLTNKFIIRPEVTGKVKRPFLFNIVCIPHNIAAQIASNSGIMMRFTWDTSSKCTYIIFY